MADTDRHEFAVQVTSKDPGKECVGCTISTLLRVNDMPVCDKCYLRAFGVGWTETTQWGQDDPELGRKFTYDDVRKVRYFVVNSTPPKLKKALIESATGGYIKTPDWVEPELPRTAPENECPDCGFEQGACLCIQGVNT